MKEKYFITMDIASMEGPEQKNSDLVERIRALEQRVTALESALMGVGRAIKRPSVAKRSPKKKRRDPEQAGPNILVTSLSRKTQLHDLSDIFNRYGQVIWISMTRGCATVYYHDIRDAEDAARDMDGREVDGSRIRIELGPNIPDLEKHKYRVMVEGLSPRIHWQDLRDYFRKAGDVDSVEINQEGLGMVQFETREAADYAVSSLNNTEWQGSKLRVALVPQ